MRHAASHEFLSLMKPAAYIASSILMGCGVLIAAAGTQGKNPFGLCAGVLLCIVGSSYSHKKG